MGLGFLNLAMLAGLVAVAIPPLIHLLNRRRHDVVDWGAMQFLKISQTTRRRLLLEELLLMAMRMGLIALFVCALAAPYADGTWFAGLAAQANRDVVLVLDGSSSMARTDGDKKSPFETAREEALAYLGGLVPGDRVALLVARQPPEIVVSELSGDLDFVRDKIGDLPGPRANPDWPRTLEIAHQLLKDQGKAARREIILYSDNQRHGWADPRTLSQWERLAPQWALGPEGAKAPRPRLVVVNTAGEPGNIAPNYSLAPLRTTRALAWLGQRLKFSGALRVEGLKEFVAPQRLYVEVDGKFAEDIALPANASLVSGQIPFSFRKRFNTPGAHLVSVLVEPDLPINTRPSGYQVRDGLPVDNRADMVVDVIRELPVLLVDGDSRLSPESSTFFLEQALAGPSDSKQVAAVRPQALPAQDWTPEMLEQNKNHSRPRVVVLADVPRLSDAQAGALEKFVAEGGGVLVILGPRLAKEKSTYNERFYRKGEGWLPAGLEKIEGDAARPEFGAGPDVKRFQHPALAVFQDDGGALGQARFPRWWKVTTANTGRATVDALLTSTDPLLVEQAYQKGRVVVCTVPLDRSWGATFPSMWEYPVFVHELVYYLADARSADWNLEPGQPLRLTAQAFASETGSGDAAPAPRRLVLTSPQGRSTSVKVDTWPWTFEDTGAVGPYRLQAEQGQKAYFVVHGDPRESDLTPCTEEDRQKVARWLPVQYGLHGSGDEAARPEEDVRQDLWWILLLGVILLLCGEVWWTRRMVLRRTAC